MQLNLSVIYSTQLKNNNIPVFSTMISCFNVRYCYYDIQDLFVSMESSRSLHIPTYYLVHDY